MRVKPKQDYSDWIFKTYRGTNLDYYMLCEPTSSDNEEKEGDNISSNRPVNLIVLTTNIEKILVYQQCAHYKDLRMKIE